MKCLSNNDIDNNIEQNGDEIEDAGISTAVNEISGRCDEVNRPENPRTGSRSKRKLSGGRKENCGNEISSEKVVANDSENMVQKVGVKRIKSFMSGTLGTYFTC